MSQEEDKTKKFYPRRYEQELKKELNEEFREKFKWKLVRNKEGPPRWQGTVTLPPPPFLNITVPQDFSKIHASDTPPNSPTSSEDNGKDRENINTLGVIVDVHRQDIENIYQELKFQMEGIQGVKKALEEETKRVDETFVQRDKELKEIFKGVTDALEGLLTKVTSLDGKVNVLGQKVATLAIQSTKKKAKVSFNSKK